MADPAQPAAIEDLLAHAEWLRALARRLVGSDDLASDVEQETWLAAIEHPPLDVSAPRKWLAQVLRNVVKQERRSESARRIRETKVARPETVEGGDEAVDRAQSLRALIDAVLQLDEPYRATILLRHQDGLSIEAIADQHDVATSTVRNRLSRGLALLRERLERRHGEAWSALLVPLLHHESTPTASSTAGGGALGVSVGVFTFMSTLKLVSAAVVVVIVAALWWKLSEPSPTMPSEVRSQPIAEAAIKVDEPAVATSEARSVAETSTNRSAPTAPAATGTRGSLVVTVTWESDGLPASGVFVRALPWGESSSFAFETSRATDAQGQARFEAVAAGQVTVGIDRADGDMAQVRAGLLTEVALKIPRGMLVRGKVVDSAGAPVGFARIWLSQHNNAANGDEVATADAVGGFTLRDVSSGRSVAARAAGLAPSWSSFVMGKPGDELALVIKLLPSGGEVRGIVRGPDGMPIADAVVLIGEEGGRWMGTNDGFDQSSAPSQRATSDQQGVFVATGIPSGRTSVQCRARGFAPFLSVIEVASSDVTLVPIQLLPGAAIAGVVLGVDGQPAGGIPIDVGMYGEFASSHMTTGVDGDFHLEGLQSGETSIRIGGGAEGEANTTLTLIAGETARLDVQLRKHGIVGGRLIDERGAALVGWRVEAIPKDYLVRERFSLTDAEGKFTIDNWPEQADALQIQEADHFGGPAALIVKPVELGRTDLVLTVPATSMATASIVGRLVGPQGEVVAGALFLWGKPGDREQYDAELNAETGEIRAQMQPGVYRFQVYSPSLGTLALPQRELHAGATLDLGVLQFTAPGRLRIKIVGPRESTDAIDPRGLFIHLHPPGELGAGPVTLGENLEGLSGPLAAGPYLIDVQGQEFGAPRTSVEVVSGEERTVEITVARTTSRSARVIWVSGKPPDDPFDYVVTDSAGRMVIENTLPADVTDGAFLGIYGLTVGTYCIDLTTTDGRSGHASFDVHDLARSKEPIEIRVR